MGWWLVLYLAFKTFAMHLGGLVCVQEAWRRLGQLWNHAQNLQTLLTALPSQGYLHTLGFSGCFVSSCFQKVGFLSELLLSSLAQIWVSQTTLRAKWGKKRERKKKISISPKHFKPQGSLFLFPLPRDMGFLFGFQDGHPSICDY